MTSEAAPFEISISDSQINELRLKLDLTHLPDELKGAGWQYGVLLADVRRLVEHWRTGYSWRVHERQINETLPQFTKDIEIDGFGTLNIHFVHQQSITAGAIPLLFIHGWPGSFLEVAKLLPLLTIPSKHHPSFHVVAISLPGFAFSEAPKKQGFEAFKYAEVCDKLMQHLRYSEYVAQGGDWGAWICRALAHSYPKRVKAIHLNYPRGTAPSFHLNPFYYLSHSLVPYTPAERAGVIRTTWFQSQSYGYNLLQSTQPQTIGYAIADSPVGLLAWIYEKLKNWSDDYDWSDDEILTWVSIYWFSRSGPAASLRIYYEVSQSNQYQLLMKAPKAKVPMGFSCFPREIESYPRSWRNTTGYIVFEATHTSGGHFAAYEKPELLVGDLRKMFGRDGPAYGVVKGSDGFIDVIKANL